MSGTAILICSIIVGVAFLFVDDEEWQSSEVISHDIEFLGL